MDRLPFSEFGGALPVLFDLAAPARCAQHRRKNAARQPAADAAGRPVVYLIQFFLPPWVAFIRFS